MKASRFLLLVPAFIFAGASAPGCSSSSGNGGDAGPGGSGTGTGMMGTGPGMSTTTTTSKTTTSTMMTTTTSGTGPGSSGTGPGNGDSGPPSGCTPQAVPGFTAAAHLTAGLTSCTNATLVTLLSDCFGMPDATAQMGCQNAVMSTCGKCIISVDTDATWGPVLFVGAGGAVQYPFGNLGGCILANDPSTDGQACGKAFEAVTECELAACESVCPVSVDMTTGAPNAAEAAAFVGTFDNNGMLTTPGCIENADSTVCAAENMALETACGTQLADGATSVAAQCEALAQSQTQAGFENFLGAYCGGGASDAGL